MRNLDIVYAAYTPLRTDDLKSGVAEYIGLHTCWQASGMVEIGPYKGDWYMVPYRPGMTPKIFPFEWVALCDLTVIEEPDWGRDGDGQ